VEVEKLGILRNAVVGNALRTAGHAPEEQTLSR
jgi:hypothetical protein